MLEKPRYYAPRVCLFLIMATVLLGTTGCFSSSKDLEIRTWYDLEEIRNNLTGHHVLMNDLDSTVAGYEELAGPMAREGKGWHPIGGPGTGSGPPFTGTLDGQGYEIRDMFINLPGIGYVGLFSIVGEGGRIENVGIVDADVTAHSYIGGLAGLNKGTVSNSYSTGSLNGSTWVGGLVGQNDGTVSNSYSAGHVTGASGAGGVMGANTGTINDSYSTGNVNGASGAGGLIAANSGTVSNSYSTSSVTGDEYLGGLVGYSDVGTVSNSFWDIEISGQSASAGGTGKTTAQMKDIATLSGVGWNIGAVGDLNERDTFYIWNIVDGVTYPFLSWQP